MLCSNGLILGNILSHKVNRHSIYNTNLDKIDKSIGFEDGEIVRIHIPIRTNDKVVFTLYESPKDKEGTEYQLKKVSKLSSKLNLFILGLSFKPGSDDLRSSKSIQLIQKLLKKGKKITAFDPISYESSKIILDKKVKVFKKPFVAKNTIYILATAWPEYIKFLSKINKKKIIDLRYVI